MNIFVSFDPRITKDEFKELVKEYDTDGDGIIDWEEFCILMKSVILCGCDDDGPMSDDDIRSAFEIADADGSGSIDKQELGHLLASLGSEMNEKDLEALFNEIDEDGSGEIDFEEFKQLLLALTAEESDDEDGSTSYTWVTASDQDTDEEEALYRENLKEQNSKANKSKK